MVLFITHDLDEAIAMSDRVVVLSAGLASRGRSASSRSTSNAARRRRGAPRRVSSELHPAIWGVLRDEVLKGYQQQLAA